MAIRVVLVGTGGWGRTWCKNTLPGGRAKGLVDIVGAVDMNPDNLKNAEEFMGLSPEQCFADLETALNTVKADACVISVRPENRLELCQQGQGSSIIHDDRVLLATAGAGQKSDLNLVGFQAFLLESKLPLLQGFLSECKLMTTDVAFDSGVGFLQIVHLYSSPS